MNSLILCDLELFILSAAVKCGYFQGTEWQALLSQLFFQAISELNALSYNMIDKPVHTFIYINIYLYLLPGG